MRSHPNTFRPGLMTYHLLDDDALLAQCDVDTFRSGGPGGQHANKTETAVRLTHRPTGTVVTERRSRSQHTNKQQALARLRQRLAKAAAPTKKRVATKPTAASRRRRLEAKRRRSDKKARRRKPRLDD
ncbi:MAG: peptide chain release factor-like protein [Bacteroidota bacterium]